jgi:hypothetical protein
MLRDALHKLAHAGLEPDQRLRRAFELAGNAGSGWGHDLAIFIALCQLNAFAIQSVFDSPDRQKVLQRRIGDLLNRQPLMGRDAFSDEIDNGILNLAIRYSEGRRTLTTSTYLLAMLSYGEITYQSFTKRPYTLDFLQKELGYPTERLLDVIEALQIAARNIKPDDFQYLLALENDRLVFRVTSILGDYVEEAPAGTWVPHRVVLRHFQDQFGGFTTDQIQELEDLVNNSRSAERDFQRFFERHPHFFRRWDHREIYSQVVLHGPDRDLIPDFILVDRELQRAAITELKLPGPKLITRQQNRTRFAAAVMEARAQLLEYRDWFREESNRLKLRDKVGMAIYEPHLTVIIGRASEFQDEVDRQKLAARTPDIEIVTYDDILLYARRREIILTGGSPRERLGLTLGG